mmetsp:Transcript_19204/g.64872  ORF Transcript_19204/g.64872 Transcript_19204/m.64872 type:complete len:275 (-) Transcript_19204:765-1589(-)
MGTQLLARQARFFAHPVPPPLCHARGPHQQIAPPRRGPRRRFFVSGRFQGRPRSQGERVTTSRLRPHRRRNKKRHPGRPEVAPRPRLRCRPDGRRAAQGVEVGLFLDVFHRCTPVFRFSCVWPRLNCCRKTRLFRPAGPLRRRRRLIFERGICGVKKAKVAAVDAHCGPLLPRLFLRRHRASRRALRGPERGGWRCATELLCLVARCVCTVVYFTRFRLRGVFSRCSGFSEFVSSSSRGGRGEARRRRFGRAAEGVGGMFFCGADRRVLAPVRR